MPPYQIRLINSEFDSSEEGEFETPEAAAMLAIVTAARVATDRISEGKINEAIEVRISDSTRVLSRHIVKLSVAQLDADA